MVSVVALMALVGAPSGSTVEILEFSAQWCGPCRTIAPAIERLQSAGFPLRQIDVDRMPQLAQQHGVTHLPTIVVLRDGQEVSRRVGARSYVELARWFKQLEIEPAGATDAQDRQPPIARGQSPDVSSATPTPRPQAQPQPSVSRPQPNPRRQPSVQRVDRAAAVRRALGATVRLKVEDAEGYSFGTGTIIDVSGPNALVVTCGHLFRDSQGKGRISVDLFGAQPRRNLPGRLVAYEADGRDIGFVVIQPGVRIEPVPVATPALRLAVGLPAFSIGCNRGADPTVEPTQVTAVNRYAHGPNLEVSGQPVDGRSGGGLFTAEGELIGICNAADPQENKGIFASLPLIHEHLARMQLSRLFQRPSTAPSANALAANHLERNGQQPPPQPANGQRHAEQGGGTDELICVVRDPISGQQRVIIVPRPTQALIQQLDNAARRPPAQQLARGTGEPPSSARGPIMRAQSER